MLPYSTSSGYVTLAFVVCLYHPFPLVTAYLHGPEEGLHDPHRLTSAPPTQAYDYNQVGAFGPRLAEMQPGPLEAGMSRLHKRSPAPMMDSTESSAPTPVNELRAKLRAKVATHLLQAVTQPKEIKLQETGFKDHMVHHQKWLEREGVANGKDTSAMEKQARYYVEKGNKSFNEGDMKTFKKHIKTKHAWQDLIHQTREADYANNRTPMTERQRERVRAKLAAIHFPEGRYTDTRSPHRVRHRDYRSDGSHPATESAEDSQSSDESRLQKRSPFPMMEPSQAQEVKSLEQQKSPVQELEDRLKSKINQHSSNAAKQPKGFKIKEMGMPDHAAHHDKWVKTLGMFNSPESEDQMKFVRYYGQKERNARSINDAVQAEKHKKWKEAWLMRARQVHAPVHAASGETLYERKASKLSDTSPIPAESLEGIFNDKIKVHSNKQASQDPATLKMGFPDHKELTEKWQGRNDAFKNKDYNARMQHFRHYQVKEASNISPIKKIKATKWKNTWLKLAQEVQPASTNSLQSFVSGVH